VFDHVRRVHGQALTDDVARCPFSNYRLSPVVAGFDGGNISSHAGGLLLGATDRAIKLISACFQDARRQDLIEHEVATRWRAATRACPELSNSACLVWRPVVRRGRSVVHWLYIRLEPQWRQLARAPEPSRPPLGSRARLAAPFGSIGKRQPVAENLHAAKKLFQRHDQPGAVDVAIKGSCDVEHDVA
jgi:hypothetical protein